MHLRILSSVLLIEKFDLWGIEMKCRKELLLAPYVATMVNITA